MIIRSMLVLALLLPLATANPAFASPAFRRVWERTDYPVQQGRGEHAWIWGPGPFTAGINEAFQNGAWSSRLVQYFDKGKPKGCWSRSAPRKRAGSLVAEREGRTVSGRTFSNKMTTPALPR